VQILHAADLHLDSRPDKKEKARKSLDQLVEHVQENNIDYIVVPGDVFEEKQAYEKGSGADLAYEYFKKLALHVKAIVIVKGNESHDRTGSISMLHQISPNIYSYEYPVILAFPGDGKGPEDLLRKPNLSEFTSNDFEILINMMPYPTKSNIITDTNIDTNNNNFCSLFDKMMDLFGMTNNHFNCPKVLGFHGNVQGARMQNGQPVLGQDIIISPHSLMRANCDYYALGHIHLPQEITANMMYSGSFYNKNFGEIEQKYFNVVQFTGTGIDVKKVPLKAARPMVNIKTEFKDGRFVLDTAGIPANAEVKFDYTVSETDRALVTEDKIDELKNLIGMDAKIVPIVVPVQRESRSEDIMKANNLTEETVEYGKVVNIEITNSIKKKISVIESGEIEFSELPFQHEGRMKDRIAIEEEGVSL